jgi:nucleotide-binding universal stress UspA family protein
METQIQGRKNKQSVKMPPEAPFFKTIVVGADFSSHSKKVFKNALALAKSWHAQVVLAHVAGLGDYNFGVYPYLNGLTGDSQKKTIEKEMKKYYAVKGLRKVKIVVEFGVPANDLILIAKKFKKPLLFIGHTEKGALSRIALGSVSRTLAVKSPIPVWIQ